MTAQSAQNDSERGEPAPRSRRFEPAVANGRPNVASSKRRPNHQTRVIETHLCRSRLKHGHEAVDTTRPVPAIAPRSRRDYELDEADHGAPATKRRIASVRGDQRYRRFRAPAAAGGKPVRAKYRSPKPSAPGDMHRAKFTGCPIGNVGRRQKAGGAHVDLRSRAAARLRSAAPRARPVNVTASARISSHLAAAAATSSASGPRSSGACCRAVKVLAPRCQARAQARRTLPAPRARSIPACIGPGHGDDAAVRQVRSAPAMLEGGVRQRSMACE